MDVYEAIHRRRSIRSYDLSRQPDDELIGRLLRAACQAPSAGNLQPWRFWVVRDSKVKDELVAEARASRFVGTAPVVLAVGADTAVSGRHYGDRGVSLYCLQDTAAAIENILLAATAEGLGACWVGAFDEAGAARALGAGESVRIIALIPAGYSADESPKPSRQDLSEVTRSI